MQNYFKTPILFLIFNRPDTTEIVFNEIKKQKPKYLFVAADGPRKNIVGEVERCQQTRDIIKQIDWDCEVKTLFREENLGCGKAINSAINWFFDNVEEGIILEDDCVPHPDFFMYCQELLEKYRDSDKIMFIGSNNFQNNIKRGKSSYYFSAFSHVWGWASWRIVWKKNIFDLNEVNKNKFDKILKFYFKSFITRFYWQTIFNAVKNKKIDTWDYQLTFSIWMNEGLAVVPNFNLVSNIGFGKNATHTTTNNSQLSNLEVFSILPLVHPAIIERDVEADAYYISKFKSMVSGVRVVIFWFKFLLPRKIISFIKKII